MPGSWWWDLLLGIAAGLLLAWAVLIAALVVMRPRGGLMRQAQTENRDQVPGLGNIPFIGAAFRNTRQTSEKRELVILLKPTVVQSDQTWAQNIDEARNRVQMLDRGFSYGGRSDVFGTQAEERKP